MSPFKLQRQLIACLLALSAEQALAKGLYAQIVSSFNSARKVTHTYLKAENALVLEFQQTSPAELAAFDTYDERLVRRIIIKDMTPAGTEIKLYLRDRDVRAVVSQFQEPFRVAVDLFDADFAEEKDPQTGMPLVAVPGAATGTAHPSGETHKLLIEADAPQAPSAPGHNANPGAGIDGDSGGRRRLLQPIGEVFVDPSAFDGALRNAGEGIGKAWATYPPYVYRLQTAAYEEGMTNGAAKATTSALLDSTALMADHAGRMFNMGHEGKALIAYQQVLLKDPGLFERDALHLWKFAESHLGQGNLTLARGYYETLLQKHPASPIAAFAALRILDVAAIRLIQSGRAGETATLTERLTAVQSRHAGELAGLKAIRQAFWSVPAVAPDAALPPVPGPAVVAELSANLAAVESKRTRFLGASLVLTEMLRPDQPWHRGTGAFAADYFKRFTGAAAEPYRSALQKSLVTKLNATLQAKVTEGRLLEAVEDYDSVPDELRRTTMDARTSWALAESYRKLGTPAKAVDFYKAAAKSIDEGPDRFKALYWLAMTAGEEAVAAKGRGAGNAAVLANTAREADRKAWTAWQQLKDDERRSLMTAYKDHFEAAIRSPARLKTGALATLAMWNQSLGTRATATAGAATEGAAGTAAGADFSPSGGAVILLSDLGKRLRELGLAAEARQAVGLMRSMKPAEFSEDQAAKRIWADQLIKLADDYRRADQFLDAGRLYSFVGAEAENWEGRAEALYKGGLLLYRAGRREEAIEAFRKSAGDGNNFYYANLAKERLSQLE